MVKGCFFHLSQNIWRKVQAVGMQGLNSQNQELAIRIRMIPALVYAAPHEVPNMFAEVAPQLPTPKQMVLFNTSREHMLGVRSQVVRTNMHFSLLGCGTTTLTQLSDYLG